MNYKSIRSLYLQASLALTTLLAACTSAPHDVQTVSLLPPIYPDYTGVTIPVGIAPLNFNAVGEDVQTVDVVVKGSKGGEMHVNGDYADFDIEDWHRLLLQNKGGRLTLTVCMERQGKWTQYKDFNISVSPYALDEWGLTYRRIAPGYEVYSKMGLYQRCLANFDEQAIIENTQTTGQCYNCHTANRTNPDQFTFHVRGEHGATMIQQQGKREWLQAKNDSIGGSMVYPYWHPTGRYCAYSTNQTRQGFHVVPKERIEVFDLSSDVLVYDVEKHEIILSPLLSTKDYSENCPVFSPDGKTLYFMTCRQQSYPLYYKQEQYNLCKIGFDPETGRFGTRVDTLFNAVKRGKSLTWPRPSYDGKYLMFTLIDYGYFSIWHKEADNWLLNLQTGEASPMTAANSDDTDGYHNWNVNSHWVVFTSRRGGGLYTRLYLASIDDKGNVSKPFLLPQRNPWAYYDRLTDSYNTPDFTSKPVDFDTRMAGKEVLSDRRKATKVR